MNKYIDFWDKELFDIRFFPNIIVGKKSDFKKRMAFAKLLSHLSSFNKIIIDGRKVLRLEKTITLDKDATIKNIIQLEGKHFSSSQSFVLEEIAISICDKYKLPRIWLVPIKVLIMTNVLYILPDSSISFHFPVEDPNPPLSRMMISNATPPFQGPGDALAAYDLSRQAAIVINENISVSKLVKLIKENTKTIDKMMHSVGRNTISQTKDKTFFWGSIASIFIQEGITNWSDMDKIINTRSPGNPFQMDTNDPILSNPADVTELQTCYKNFIASLNKI